MSTPWGMTETSEVRPRRRIEQSRLAFGEPRVGDEAIDKGEGRDLVIVAKRSVERDVGDDRGAGTQRGESVDVGAEHPEVVEEEDEGSIEGFDEVSSLDGAVDVAAVEVARVDGDAAEVETGSMVANADVVDVVFAGKAGEDALEDAAEPGAGAIDADGDEVSDLALYPPCPPFAQLQGKGVTVRARQRATDRLPSPNVGGGAGCGGFFHVKR